MIYHAALGRRAAMLAIGLGVMAVSAMAQAQIKPYSSGLMMGSTIEDRINPRGRHNNDRWPAPQPGYTGGARFIPGSGYYGGGGNVVIVNNGPCYVPSYYGGMVVGGGYGGYSGYGTYSSSGLSVNYRVGGVSLGYQQSTGYLNQYAPPVVPTGGYVVDRTVIQPVIVQDDRSAQYSEPVRTAVRPAQRKSTSDSDENDYYLHKKPTELQKDAGLAQAVAEIETAFRTGNAALLERHIDANEKLTLQIQDRERKELPASDYLAMTRDALKMMKTERYVLDHVEPASGGAKMVYGTHTLRGEQGGEKSFRVGFVLQKRGDKWMIAEVSAEPLK